MAGMMDYMGGSARDSAPQQLPNYNPNMNPMANYWQGNQFVIPPFLQQLMQQHQGMAGMMGQGQGQAQQQQKTPGFLSQFLQGGGLGLLPALLSQAFK